LSKRVWLNGSAHQPDIKKGAGIGFSTRERCKGTTCGELVGDTNVFSVGGGRVYGKAVNEGLCGTTLGMTGSMMVKEVWMDSYEKISSWKTTSQLVKTFWVWDHITCKSYGQEYNQEKHMFGHKEQTYQKYEH